MPLVVIEDEARDPLNVTFLGAPRMAAHAHDLPHLIEVVGVSGSQYGFMTNLEGVR
jgi:hypothetical protein